MDSNTKQTPKSCSCTMCQMGKHCKTGKFFINQDQRAYRRATKIQLAKEEDPVMGSAPIGNYYD